MFFIFLLTVLNYFTLCGVIAHKCLEKRTRERTVPSTEYLDRKLVEFVHNFLFISFFVFYKDGSVVFH